MIRSPSALAFLLCCLSSTASAAPHMWGIGPRIGTTFLPNAVPAINFPPRIENYNFIEGDDPRAGDPNAEQGEQDRDLDASGAPRFTSLERVRFDVTYGVDGFYAIDANNRIGGMIGFGSGRRFFDAKFAFTYDRVLVMRPNFSLVGGLGLGFGQLRFAGLDPEESLRVPYYPLRGRLQAQILDKVRLYGLGLNAELGIPSNTFYTDLDGNAQDVSYFNVARNITVSADLQIMFGDFTPPRPRKPRRSGQRRPRGNGRRR